MKVSNRFCLLVQRALFAAMAAFPAIGVACDAGEIDPGSRQTEELEPRVGAEGPAFTFLSETGEVNAALRTIWLADRTPASTSEAASARWRTRANAEAVVRANLPEARRILLANLTALSADDEHGHVALAGLLETAGSDSQLRDHLHALLMAPPPPAVPGDDETHPNRIVRNVALGLLIAEARAGGIDAQRLVFDLVTSPDPVVQRAAVRTRYALSPDRRVAQLAMRRLMNPSSYHLLYSE